MKMFVIEIVVESALSVMCIFVTEVVEAVVCAPTAVGGPSGGKKKKKQKKLLFTTTMSRSK